MSMADYLSGSHPIKNEMRGRANVVSVDPRDYVLTKNVEIMQGTSIPASDNQKKLLRRQVMKAVMLNELWLRTFKKVPHHPFPGATIVVGDYLMPLQPND
jgi:hypothetical protein